MENLDSKYLLTPDGEFDAIKTSMDGISISVLLISSSWQRNYNLMGRNSIARIAI